MRTIVLATLTQTIIAIVIFTFAGIISTGLVYAQILFFTTHLLQIVFPLVLVNLIEYGLLTLLFNKTKLHTTKSTMLFVSLIWGLCIGIFVFILQKQPIKFFFGFNISIIQLVLVTMFFWIVMSLILTYFFKRNRETA